MVHLCESLAAWAYFFICFKWLKVAPLTVFLIFQYIFFPVPSISENPYLRAAAAPRRNYKIFPPIMRTLPRILQTSGPREILYPE